MTEDDDDDEVFDTLEECVEATLADVEGACTIRFCLQYCGNDADTMDKCAECALVNYERGMTVPEICATLRRQQNN